ncbi:MAG: tRNA pseudouridine(55) synthase TruB, partial [Dehalococcoidia bacterium]|nr:tRNA pseudouridine(55) synthase TruB [Dehalococcoidia bacterium]
QEPPMFSALHHQGKRLYELAREGIEVPRRARVRQVYEIRLVDWACPLLTVELKCEGGFYVRSLASDLGQRLGCGASIKELCRLKQGEFSLSESLTVEEVEDAFRNGWVSLAVHPVDTPLIQKKAAILSDVDERHFLQGRVIQLSGPGEPDQPDQAARTQVEPEPTGEVCRVYSAAGYFIAVGKWDEKNGLLHPKKVFCPPGVSKPPSFLTQTGENTF